MRNQNWSPQSEANDNIVAQTEYEISNVSHSVVTENLNYSEPCLTWLPKSRSDNNKEFISAEEFLKRLNEYKKPSTVKEKSDNSGILKGIYEGYFSGENCTKTAEYLPFDIDVKNSDKPKENKHLLNPVKNEIIFKELQKQSGLCWKSDSRWGMAGLLYVPQIAQYTHNTRKNHLQVGNAITNYLSDYLYKKTGIRVVFDQAQSKFRQPRLVADQRGAKVTLNPKPFCFTYDSKVVEKKTTTGVTNYKYSNYQLPENSIYSQFNNNNRILDVLLANDFTEVSKSGNEIRVKHPSSNSDSSGVINVADNTYINFSSSFDSSGKIRFTPSDIVCKMQFDSDWKRFRNYLHSKGYEDLPVTEQTMNTASSSLSEELEGIEGDEDASLIIFKHCFHLKYASYEQKRQFIEENCTQPHFRKLFEAHLKYVDYKIRYDNNLIIEKYVSEILSQILDYADQHNKVILKADTGSGKTTAFIRNFHTYRPNCRVLILAPLTIIVYQMKKKYAKDAVFLTGKSDGFEHERARSAKLVFATYEQGTRHLEQHTFDYIVIDEVHQLLTANSFKSDVIAGLTSLIKDTKTIGLTGSPSDMFSMLGYKLLDVDVKSPNLMWGEVRFSNRSVSRTVMTHLLQRPQGKVLIRVNGIDPCKAIIKELIQKRIYRKNEILQLYSTSEIKGSTDYMNLAHNSKFLDRYKIVFTTSLIDEGLSIDQAGFTDVIFIETDYNPRPEPIKQFFARFRNEDANRKNYLYLRKKKCQIPTCFRPQELFENGVEALQNNTNDESMDVLTTYDNLFSNNNYYYNNENINPYYLAFASTELLFQKMNIEQFLAYLKLNYNLGFTRNDSYEVRKLETNENGFKKELNKQIAMYWLEENDQILQMLLYHSQDPRIFKKITKQSLWINEEIEVFANDNIKHFEELFLRGLKLQKMGIDNTQGYLIEKDKDNEWTLVSNNKYNNRLAVLKVDKAIHDPKTKADKRTANQFLHFAQWCELRGRFTSNQMYTELKRIMVLNYMAYKNEQMLFEILSDNFNLEVKRNRKTNLIICRQRGVV